MAEQVTELVEKHFVYRVMLDLHAIPELSSNVIGELVQLRSVHPQARRRSAGVRCLLPESRAMLEMCGLDDLCLAYKTREEAILGLVLSARA